MNRFVDRMRRGAIVLTVILMEIAFGLFPSRARAATVNQDEDALDRINSDIEVANELVGLRPDLGAYRPNVEAAKNAVDADSCKAGRSESCRASIAKADAALDPLANFLKGFDLYYVGHAHIDLNWQWLWPETVQTAHDTFSTVLQLMKEYPDFKFSQSQAPLYMVMEERYPEIFEQIRQRVAEGRWELTGGSWAEGDMNMASGEGITRSILYAKRYYREKFGKDVEVLWAPDTFGHAWTIPQIMKKSGLKYYYFSRCKPDYPLFWWEGPDGSRVMGYTMWFYNEAIKARDAVVAPDVQMRSGPKMGAVVFGVGDHGGGPTRRDLDKAIEFGKRRFFPSLHYSTFKDFMDKAAPKDGKLPVVRNEMNFVFRGCYTTHGDIKKGNRKAEGALQLAETASAFAAIFGRPYDHKGFETAWRNVGFNLFHDLMDGSAIHRSYEYSAKLYAKAFAVTDTETAGALASIGKRVRVDTAKGMPVLVFNDLGWKRDAPVEVEKEYSTADIEVKEKFPDPSVPFIATDGKSAVPAQIVAVTPATNTTFVRFSFVARDVPVVGYKVYYLKQVAKAAAGVTVGETFIENKFYRVEVDAKRGVVTRIYDKINKREVVPAGAESAVFQMLHESPNGMSAWDIGNITRTQALNTAATVTIEERGPARGALRIEQSFGRTALVKKIVLYDGVPRIDIPCEVQWREIGSSVVGMNFLKMAFPAAVQGGTATFEIPYGSIVRPANGDEVPAIQWTDLSNGEYGVSILNDSKYGHDVNGNVMRVSLIRSSFFPDPRPDYGFNAFTLSVYPHKRGWLEGGTVQEAWSFNHPLAATLQVGGGGNADLPETYSLMRLTPASLALSAVKLSEDGNRLVVRFYDTAEADGKGTIAFAPGIGAPRETDLIENQTSTNRFRKVGEGYEFNYGKYEVVTLEAELPEGQKALK